MLPLGVLLWSPAAAQNCQMSSIRLLKAVKSCHGNHYFTIMEKWFFRYLDGIFPAYSILRRLQLHKLPNVLDQLIKSGQIMLSKSLFFKNGKIIFSISWWYFPAYCLSNRWLVVVDFDFDFWDFTENLAKIKNNL